MSVGALIELAKPKVQHQFFSTSYTMQEVMDVIAEAYDSVYENGLVEEDKIPTFFDLFRAVDGDFCTHMMDRIMHDKDVFWYGSNVYEDNKELLESCPEDYDDPEEYDELMLDFETNMLDVHSNSGGLDPNDDGFGKALVHDIKMVLDLGNYTYLDVNTISEELPSGLIIERKKIINDPICEVW
jgi:hypothetical protein